MAALHYCMVEWPGHHKLASAGSAVVVQMVSSIDYKMDLCYVSYFTFTLDLTGDDNTTIGSKYSISNSSN